VGAHLEENDIILAAIAFGGWQLDLETGNVTYIYLSSKWVKATPLSRDYTGRL
jgi:hypothetical protein